MSQPFQSSDTTAPVSAEPAAPTPAAEPTRFYSAAEQRAAILERTGAANMGAFHPAAPRAQDAAEPAPEAPAAPVEAPTAPPEPSAPARDDGELAALRAELATLQQRMAEPEQVAPAPPATPPHPLEAHARQVLGDGAQPHHVARAVELYEQQQRWKAFVEHHEMHPSDAAPAEIAKAKRAMAQNEQQIADLTERAQLHAAIAALKGEREKPTPEQRKQARGVELDGILGNEQVMGQHHPNLARAMSADPAMRESVKAYLLALPEDDATFRVLGNHYLHAMDAMAAKVAPSAPAPAAPQAASAPAATPPRQTPAPRVAPAPGAAPPNMAKDGPRVPIHMTPPAPEQPFVSRRDHWERVNNNWAARHGN